MQQQAPIAPGVSRNKIITLILFATPFVIALFATLWFINPQLHPVERTSIGTLVVPQVLLPERMHHAQRRWQAITVVQGKCDDKCRERVWIMRNAYWALGKQAGRGSDALLRLGGTPDTGLLAVFPDLNLYAMSEAEMQQLVAAHPQLPQPAHLEVWLVDPLGYVVLRYNREHTGNNLLTDWRKLLRISQIG